MTGMTRPISCVAAFIMGLAASAQVQAQTPAPYFVTPPQLDISPQHLPALSTNKTYAVDIDCTPKGGQLLPIKDNSLIRQTYTTSHAILISTQQAASATLAPGTLPSGGLGMTIVYITDGTTGSATDNRNHGCKSSFIIRRQNNVFLVPFISLHTADQAGIVTTIFAAVLTPFTSLFSLITGGPLASAASTRITNFQNVVSGFNTVLSKLNNDFNLAKTLPLGVGTTTITTAQSVTTVKVREVQALIKDSVDDFSNALRTLADSETVKVTQANPAGTCIQLANNVAQDGIRAPEDQAYILGYEGIRNLQTKDDLMHCLGRLVKVAAGIPAIWADQPTMTITPATAAAFYDANFTGPEQLAFSDIKGTLDHLMVALGRYAQNGQPPSAANKSTLAQFFITTASLSDISFAGVFKSDSIPSGFPAIIDFLITKGYYHFGCFAQTTDQTGISSDNAQSIFLMFKAPPGATSAKKTDTLAIHPIFTDDGYTIQTWNVSDNADWISAVLAGRAATPPTVSDCNGFTVQ
jgi:hypothetical protein